MPYAIPTHVCAPRNKALLPVFDDEGHGIIKLKNKLMMYPIVVEVLDRHLKG